MFWGTGKMDSYGLGLDNIKLIRYSTNQNIMVNGDFENPQISKTLCEGKVFRDIPGW